MEKHVCHFLLMTLYLSTVPVLSQRPQIVEQIITEVKRKGETGYLNCTVSRQRNHKVIWIQPDPNSIQEAWISKDTTIIAKNEEEKGKLKYEVIRKFRGNDRTTYTLVVNRLTVFDGGRYKCTIFMPTESLDLWPTKYGNLTVQVPPEMIVSQTSNAMTLNLGDDLSLKCNATGSPTPNITWVRANGRPLPNNALTYRGHVYNITHIKKDDRGTYTCVADNSVIPPAFYDIRIFVKFKPEAKSVQSTVGQAQNRRFHASVECIIAASGSWLGDRFILFGIQFANLNGQMVLGNKRATSTEILGCADYNLNITGEVDCISFQMNDNNSVPVGLTVYCTCPQGGNPEPVLRWYIKTNSSVKTITITDNQKYEVNKLLPHGTSLMLNEVWYALKIKNVQANDFGDYYCEGTNKLGTASAVVRLYETNECQGADCPSINAVRGPNGCGCFCAPSLTCLLLMLFAIWCSRT